MEQYEILLTEDAVDDLKELRDYIADVLLSPETALEYVRTVHVEIAGLADYPARYRLMEEEPWHSRGVRRLIAKNFFVYYRIDEAARRVYVLNVIYARRDQLRALWETNRE